MTDIELEKEAEIYRKDIKSKFFLSEPQLDLACQGFKDGIVFGFNKSNEWHDLRKNPQDLPDTDRNVWVKRESEIECQIDNYYDDEDGKGWGIMFREGYCTDDVVAWCELPIYEGETKPNTSQELKGQDILDENETTERKWHLPDDFKIIDIEPFDYDTVYNGLPAYDYNTGKRLK